MNAAEAGLRFPVLAFTSDGDVWGVPTLDILTRCGALTLKTNLQVGMELVDADCRRWTVRAVRRLGRDRPFPAWLWWTLLAGAQYRIEQDLEPAGSVTLEELRARVAASVEADAAEQELDGEELKDVRKQVAKLRRAASVQAIYDLAGLDDFRAR